MKLVIVLAALICCSYAQSSTQSIATPLRDQLERRAVILDTRIKFEIKRLESEKRGHLTQLLQEEEKRLETLANELKEVKADDVIRLSILEERLIRMEFRVDHEVIILQREEFTQELLLSRAKALREWTNEEIKSLEATEGAGKQQAERAAQQLKRSEQRLNEMAKELAEAKDQHTIERLEVELRVIEVRIYEELKALNFNPSTGTPATATPPGSTRPATASPTGTAGPTTAAPVTEVRKEKLIEKATQLEKRADKEIKTLTAEGKTSEADVLKKEVDNIKKLVTQLEATTDSNQTELKRIEKEVNLAENKLKELIKEDRATTTAAY